MRKILVFVILAFLCIASDLLAWCEKTHITLTETAIYRNNNCILDDYLRYCLHYSEGLNTDLSLDQSIILPSNRIPDEQLEERIPVEIWLIMSQP
ncbi:MAG TPA: hypothetical protein PLX18_05420 [Anaerohalosphaeraceae bacterium]|nr:hypothetical protein [Anaerohalosphaeraceae bacterium]HQI07281.1 hypothetical protein [Anaerohalosphaeraceae bacterium]HQJ69045.1 hypothetical protein [Anaerohalosphaeraceae bacterium]